MARDIRINYLYASPKIWARYDLACDQLGWANKSLVQQCIHAFLGNKENRVLYAEAAIKDAEARGMDAAEYYRVLRDASEENLTRYTNGRPAFGATPLDRIPFLETTHSEKRRYNTITLSNYNFVLLRVARIIDTGPMVQLVSRILEHHFDVHWEKRYKPQIDRDTACSFN